MSAMRVQEAIYALGGAPRGARLCVNPDRAMDDVEGRYIDCQLFVFVVVVVVVVGYGLWVMDLGTGMGIGIGLGLGLKGIEGFRMLPAPPPRAGVGPTWRE
jgi:hypothetical protein